MANKDNIQHKFGKIQKRFEGGVVYDIFPPVGSHGSKRTKIVNNRKLQIWKTPNSTFVSINEQKSQGKFEKSFKTDLRDGYY